VRQEAVAQAEAVVRALDQARDVDDAEASGLKFPGAHQRGQLFEPGIGDRQHGLIGLDGGKRVGTYRRAATGQNVKERGLADVRQA